MPLYDGTAPCAESGGGLGGLGGGPGGGGGGLGEGGLGGGASVHTEASPCTSSDWKNVLA